MAVWLNNLRTLFRNKEVIILHGNVRDKYIHPEKALTYCNLSELLKDLYQESAFNFAQTIFYDPIGKERKADSGEPASHSDMGNELSATLPNRSSSGQNADHARVLAKWLKILQDTRQNTVASLFYLDKLVSYKSQYAPDEQEYILWIEKIIENITPNNRLIMVALQDTLIPVEFYTHSPKVAVLPIPNPGKQERAFYLSHRLGDESAQHELTADLADGLFLRDLDNIVREISANSVRHAVEVKKIVDRYRIGETEDYWSQIDVHKLNGAFHWFVAEKGVKGQDEAIHKVVQTLIVARAGLCGLASGALSRPKGVLFFCGPSGVGKTFLAKKLAEFLFSSEDAFIRFDMSEFKEEHTVSKLIGSPPGYIGHERGGLLTNAIRQKPFSVVLFDEIEKAHPKILDLFLQIIDEGRLTDSRGQTLFFTETVIIFTSNIGTRSMDSTGKSVEELHRLNDLLNGSGGELSEKKAMVKEHFIDSVEKFFLQEISRPELLNRIGNNIVPFNYIDTPEVQAEIIASHLHRIKREVEERNKQNEHRIEFSEGVQQFLVEKYGSRFGFYGGRGITNALADEIIVPLSIALLRAEYRQDQGKTFVIEATQEGLKVN